jgi:hypothetical protein
MTKMLDILRIKIKEPHPPGLGSLIFIRTISRIFVKHFQKKSPQGKNSLERRPLRFSTICAKIHLLKLNIDKVTVILRRKPPSAPVGVRAQFINP